MDNLVDEGIAIFFENPSNCRGSKKLDTDIKDKIYFVIDNIIQNVKAKKALAS